MVALNEAIKDCPKDGFTYTACVVDGEGREREVLIFCGGTGAAVLQHLGSFPDSWEGVCKKGGRCSSSARLEVSGAYADVRLDNVFHADPEAQRLRRQPDIHPNAWLYRECVRVHRDNKERTTPRQYAAMFKFQQGHAMEERDVQEMVDMYNQIYRGYDVPVGPMQQLWSALGCLLSRFGESAVRAYLAYDTLVEDTSYTLLNNWLKVAVALHFFDGVVPEGTWRSGVARAIGTTDLAGLVYLYKYVPTVDRINAEGMIRKMALLAYLGVRYAPHATLSTLTKSAFTVMRTVTEIVRSYPKASILAALVAAGASGIYLGTGPMHTAMGAAKVLIQANKLISPDEIASLWERARLFLEVCGVHKIFISLPLMPGLWVRFRRQVMLGDYALEKPVYMMRWLHAQAHINRWQQEGDKFVPLLPWDFQRLSVRPDKDYLTYAAVHARGGIPRMPVLPGQIRRWWDYVVSFFMDKLPRYADEYDASEVKTPVDDDEAAKTLVREHVFTGDPVGGKLGVPSVLMFLPEGPTNQWKMLRKHLTFQQLWTEDEHRERRAVWLDRCVTKWLLRVDNRCGMFGWPPLGRLEPLRSSLKPEYSDRPDGIRVPSYVPLEPSCYKNDGTLKMSNDCRSRIVKHLNEHFDAWVFSNKRFRTFASKHIRDVNKVLRRPVAIQGGYVVVSSWANVRIL